MRKLWQSNAMTKSFRNFGWFKEKGNVTVFYVGMRQWGNKTGIDAA